MKKRVLIGSVAFALVIVNLYGCSAADKFVENAKESYEWTEEHGARTNGESVEERLKDNIEDFIGEIDEPDASGQDEEGSQTKSEKYGMGDTINLIDENSGEMELVFTDWGITYDIEGKPVLYISYHIQNTGEGEIQVGDGMFGIYADNYKVSTSCLVDPDESVTYANLSAGRNIEGKIYADVNPDKASNIEVECGNVVVAVKGGTQTENKNSAEENMTDSKSKSSKDNLVDFYSRGIGPKCGLSVWSADEKGISFAIGIGSSGYLAYVDLRDCIAEWTGDNTAVYVEEYGERNYNLTFTVQEDGFITLSENLPYSEEFSLAGDYIKDKMAEDHCEFVFPEDNVFPIEPSELEGKTATECKIARNEIYARHGRRFNDEQLQGYFDICSWYEGTVSPEAFSEGVLNEVEKSNLQVISEYESKMGYR